MDKPTTPDTPFWTAVVIVSVVTAFSLLIMGIFAHDGANPWIRLVGMDLVLAGPLFLGLMLIARTAGRRFAARTGGRARSAALAMIATYALGTPAIVIGTYTCVGAWLDAPLYQEASLEGPNAIPMY